MTPWTAAPPAFLSFSLSQSLLKLMSIESVMTLKHLILYCPLLPSIFPSIRVSSSEPALCIRWPKYWSFNFSTSPCNEYFLLISCRIDWFDLLAVQRALKSLLQAQPLFIVQPSTSVHDYWRKHSFDYTDLCRQSDVSAF